ncbi:MAG TPA: ABC transporter ATP-binding protein [Acetobacteraceae bacterium]|nr:ABC transporter ATP-binding protein [Acetobacteraceae bacterium]
MLAVAGLDAWYGRAQALFGVELAVAAGEAVALLGRNGAGKSTTFRAIMGLLERRAALLHFAGSDIGHLPVHGIARLGLGYVPEDRRIFTDLTVEENLDIGRRPARDGAAWTAERVYAVFPNLGEMRRRPGGRMSGGEQQMLAIGRALMGNPRLILLDEPAEGLAPRIVEQMAQAILAMKRQGIGLVLSEQNLHFARLIADRAYVIEKGRVRLGAAMAELQTDPGSIETWLAP